MSIYQTVKTILIISPNLQTFLSMFSYNFSGITCRPSRVTKGTQTESASQPVIVPVMVPIYLPVPMQMYQRPLPVPVPMPLPIPGKLSNFSVKREQHKLYIAISLSERKIHYYIIIK